MKVPVKGLVVPVRPRFSLAAIAEVGVPILALAVGIMAALYAQRCHTSQWAVVFVTLATLAVVLPAIGLSLDHLLALAYAPTLQAVGRVAVYTQLLISCFRLLARAHLRRALPRGRPWSRRRINPARHAAAALRYPTASAYTA